MNPAWPRGSLFAVNRELPVTEASMPDRLTCSRINEEIHKLTLLRNDECQNDRAYLAMFLLLVVVTASAWAQTAATSGEVENVFPQARALYVDVHQNPELSGHETQTAEKLVSRLPKPDVAVALHTSNELPAGKVGVASGYRYANADSVRITIFGKGGHGSAPHTTVDPIVIAARTILALQTITSREVKPGEAAVVTVGYIQAGTKNNIIPDQAELGLTVRSYKPEIRKQVLAAITRITKAEAVASGAQPEPLIEHYEATDAVYNDPALAQRLERVLESAIGRENVAGCYEMSGW